MMIVNIFQTNLEDSWHEVLHTLRASPVGRRRDPLGCGLPFGPSRRGDRIPFTFTLEHEDGSLAEPHTFATAVPNWSPGDTIPLGGYRTLRVVEVRDGSDPDDDPVLVVEPV